MDIKCSHCGSYLNIREVVTRCTECGKELFNSKKENMNPFKVKDTVHHIKYGKGIVIEVQNDTVLVAYEDESHWHSDLSLLSFTEYTLQGFSQERRAEPEIGKFYWLWDEEMIDNEEVAYAKLADIDKDGEDWIYHTKGSYYYFISETNPLECQ
jgi:hypothetical protein